MLIKWSNSIGPYFEKYKKAASDAGATFRNQGKTGFEGWVQIKKERYEPICGETKDITNVIINDNVFGTRGANGIHWIESSSKDAMICGWKISSAKA